MLYGLLDLRIYCSNLVWVSERRDFSHPFAESQCLCWCLQALNRNQTSQHQEEPSSGCYPRVISLSQKNLALPEEPGAG